MPYNVFGEYQREGCTCEGCRRIGNNALRSSMGWYDSRAHASRALAQFIDRNYGERPPSRHVIGRSRHRPPIPPSVQYITTEGPWDRSAIFQTMETLRRQLPPPGLSPRDEMLFGLSTEDPRRNYTYKPTWVMLGEGPAFYGLEIEVRCRDTRVMQYAVQALGNYAVLKNDSSIGGGFEIVTHPMSHDWAAQNFPWQLLPDLQTLGCTIEPSTNGLHVHVNRAGFRSDAHTLRWLKFFYRNRMHATRIARRRADQWGAFGEEAQASQYQHIKVEKARARLMQAQEEWNAHATEETARAEQQARMEYDTLRRGDRTSPTRYQAINTGNRETLEVRIFASTLGIPEAKAALGLVAATVEYTRNITAHDVCGGGWGWVPFSRWLASNEDKYPDLYQANRFARMPRRPSATFVMSDTPRRGW